MSPSGTGKIIKILIYYCFFWFENIIRTQDVNAEYAIGATADNFAAIFEAMDDAYMQGRAADVRDVSERLLQALSSQNETVMVMDEL